MSEPDRRDASTTTTPAERPAMMRLRIGKFCGRGSVPGGYSETRTWSAASRSFSGRVLARVVDVEAAAEDGDRSARTLERGLVRRRVDAAREARDDRHARARQLPREREATSRPYRVASREPTIADGGEAQPLEAAEREEDEGRVGDLAQGRRVLVVEGRQETHAGALDARGPAHRPRRRRRPRRTARAKSSDRSSRGQLVLVEARSALDAAARAERPARGAGGSAARPRAQERAAQPRGQTRAHRFNVLLMERHGPTIPGSAGGNRKPIIPTRPRAAKRRSRLNSNRIVAFSLLLVAGACTSYSHTEKASTQIAFGTDVAKKGLWREAAFRFEQAVAEGAQQRPRPQQPRRGARGERRFARALAEYKRPSTSIPTTTTSAATTHGSPSSTPPTRKTTGKASGAP